MLTAAESDADGKFLDGYEFIGRRSRFIACGGGSWAEASSRSPRVRSGTAVSAVEMPIENEHATKYVFRVAADDCDLAGVGDP